MYILYCRSGKKELLDMSVALLHAHRQELWANCPFNSAQLSKSLEFIDEIIQKTTSISNRVLVKKIYFLITLNFKDVQCTQYCRIAKISNNATTTAMLSIALEVDERLLSSSGLLSRKNILPTRSNLTSVSLF